MAIPQLDLGESRTGFSASVTADGSDDSFNDVLAWGSSNADPLLVETVEDSSIVSTTDSDSGTTLVDNGDDTYTYSGLFSFDSFPNVTMTFRDFSADPASDITITGWPPSDDRAKDMHTVALDSRDARTYTITIAWKISATLEVVTPPEDPDDPDAESTSAFINQTSAPYSYDATLDKYVRTDTYTFYKDAVNRTGELFAAVLGSYFNGS